MAMGYERQIRVTDSITAESDLRLSIDAQLADIRNNGFGVAGTMISHTIVIGGDKWDIRDERKAKIAKRKAEFEAIFTLAGIPILRMWELPNGYDPENYPASPWFLIQTKYGLIEIGWRKRVIAIDWSATQVRGVVTTDEVTKNDTSVHAWSEAAAIGYLKAWEELAFVQCPVCTFCAGGGVGE